MSLQQTARAAGRVNEKDPHTLAAAELGVRGRTKLCIKKICDA